MRTTKGFIILLITILIIMAVSGCMNENIDRTAYEQAILRFLEQKYSDKFEIHDLYQEFEGNNGMIIRALSKGSSYTDMFTVNCYLDSTVTDEAVEIEGRNHSIEDGYSEVIFQNQLMALLDQSNNAHEVIVKCRVDFHGRKPSSEQFARGIDYCIQCEDLDSHIMFYILSDDNDTARDLQIKAENIVAQYMPCVGYIYYAVQSQFDENEIVQQYIANQFDFGNYLTSSELADKVEFTLYKKESGFRARQIVKG